MNSEKVKEIKNALKDCANNEIVNELPYVVDHKLKTVAFADILTYINELESENDGYYERATILRRENEQLKTLVSSLENQITELKDRIALLDKDNELLRNAKVVYERVDYCYEDLKKAEKRIIKLKKENTSLKKLLNGRVKVNKWLQEVITVFAEKYNDKLHEQKSFFEKSKVSNQSVICGFNWAEKLLNETLKEYIDKT